jgi:hypothetical protein
MNHLIDHLLANRSTIPDRVIVDCIALARLQPSPDQSVSWLRVAEALGVGSCRQPYLSQIVRRLVHYDLVDYDRGARDRPGYRFLRVGPPAAASVARRAA